MKKFYSFNDWGEVLKYFGIVLSAVIFIVALESNSPFKTVFIIFAVGGVLLSIIVGNIISQIIGLLKDIAKKNDSEG